ncbi:hypothetical protein AAVH_27587 [Aphelenchoides avenae]|nr:hypothetical protein AAVH_27587 [Aphelenchus avenae]
MRLHICTFVPLLRWNKADTVYNRAATDNVIKPFKVCGVGALGDADGHLIYCLKGDNVFPHGLYELAKGCDAAEERF